MARTSQKQIDCQKNWEEKIQRSKKVREHWKTLFKVDLARDYFDGRQNPGYPSNEWVTINKIYSHLKSQLPSLYAADPYFYVKLRRSFSPNAMDIALWEKRGRMRQSMLNYLKDELKLKIKARLCIQDAHFAYGVMKVHYKAEQVKNPSYGNTIMSEETESPLYDDNGEPLLEPEYIPVNERYKITRIHPDDFLFDEDAGPLEDDWTWVAQRVRMTLSDAQKDLRYSKTALKLLEGKGETKDDEEKKREERQKGSEVRGRSEVHSFNKKKTFGKDELVVFWEIYNLKKKTWLMIAENGEIPIIDEKKVPPGVEKHCFALLRFTLRDNSPYPIPPLSQGIDPQKEYNMSRSQLLTHRKRFNRKYLAKGNWANSEDELAKIESGDDGTIAVVPMGAELDPIKDAPLDQQRYIELGFLNQDMIELLGGTSDESRGIAGAESATQAGILDKRLEIKEGDAMSMVVDFIKDIARKLDMQVQTHITKDEAVRVTGPQGEFWEIIKASEYENINGEYEYSVNVGATMPRMPQMERASWQAFLQLLGNFPHLLAQKHLLKRMAEMHHIEDEAMLEELYQLGRQILTAQVPMPGQSGSQPGVGEDRPISAMGGQAGGPLSLGMPGAGNFQ